MTQGNTGNKPEKKFRAGAVSATVWLNQGQARPNGQISTYRTITLERGYKDNNDQWQNTTSLRINDVPRARMVLRQAFEFMVTQPNDASPQPNQQQGAPQQQPYTQEETVM